MSTPTVGTIWSLGIPLRATSQLLVPRGPISASRRAGVWSASYAPFQYGDVDGDGRDDIVGYNAQTGTVSVVRSNGHGFNVAQAWTTGWGIYGDIRLADVDADGRDDLVAWHPTMGDIAVLFRGDLFGVAASWGSWSASYAPFQYGDVDGDGRDDIVGYNAQTGTVSVVRSNGHGFNVAQAWTTGWGTGYSNIRLANIDGCPYSMSCRYGGPDAKISTPTEVSNFISVFDSAASDAVARDLIENPARRSPLEHALLQRVNNGDLVRDVYSGRVWNYSGGTLRWIPSTQVAQAVRANLSTPSA